MHFVNRHYAYGTNSSLLGCLQNTSDLKRNIRKSLDVFHNLRFALKGNDVRRNFYTTS